MKYIFYLVGLISLTSCLKEEEPIAPFDRGGVQLGGIDINDNSDYSKQIYYDIEKNEVVRTVERSSWDLAFESAPGGIHILTNTASKVTVAKTGETDFANVTDLSAMTLNFKWDDASGNEDSLALKDWISGGVPTNEVFVVDRGEKPNLVARGVKKLKIISVSSTEFVIQFANMNGTDFQTMTIPKNQNKHFTAFSFDNGGQLVEVEPDKTKWDFVFTQYLATFYDLSPQLSYSVNGILINRNECKGVKVFDKEFSEISSADIGAYPLNDSANVIGFEWKQYDFDEATYAVVPGMNYILQSKSGLYYKMRMIDFYSTTGLKGSPRFEFELL
jgi:hypothetical protein